MNRLGFLCKQAASVAYGLLLVDFARSTEQNYFGRQDLSYGYGAPQLTAFTIEECRKKIRAFMVNLLFTNFQNLALAH